MLIQWHTVPFCLIQQATWCVMGLSKPVWQQIFFSATMQDFWIFFFGFLKIKNWHFLKDSEGFWHLAKISVTTVSFYWFGQSHVTGSVVWPNFGQCHTLHWLLFLFALTSFLEKYQGINAANDKVHREEEEEEEVSVPNSKKRVQKNTRKKILFFIYFISLCISVAHHLSRKKSENYL